MSHLDILLPFGLPPAEISADLFRELNTPALAMLTARARSDTNASRHEVFEDFQRALPHEIWLSRQFGLRDSQSGNSSPPIASALMHSFGLSPGSGSWFVVQPVHIHIARDHLVLTDPRQLVLTDDESSPLFEVAKALFEEDGKVLIYGNANTWFARAQEWSALQTATPDAAAGHNIDIWMPKGTGERQWRKLQNEVQMHWFNHPINEQRETSGRKSINSLWLWGGPATLDIRPSTPYAAAFNLHGWMQSVSQFVQHHATAENADALSTAKTGHNLLVLDALLEPALANDWASWLDHMRSLESAWFAPILQAVKSGKLDQVSIVLTHNTRVSSFTATRTSLRKFWVKPTLATLCP